MSKIFCLVGKSGSGKDTIYHRILSEGREDLLPVIPYTTRPKRANEQDGVHYFFVSTEQMREFERQGRIVEQRCYHTTKGVWSYFTLQFSCTEGVDRILITTLDGVRGLLQRYPVEAVHTVYLDLADKDRLLRCIERESQQRSPDYPEVCRRYLADHADFSAEHLREIPNLHVLSASGKVEETLEAWWKLYQSLSG